MLHWIAVGFLVSIGWWLFENWFKPWVRDGWYLFRPTRKASSSSVPVASAKKPPLSTTEQLGTISRQLTNLYILLSFKGTPSENVSSGMRFESDKLLHAWKQLNLYALIGSGMSPEDAHTEVSNIYFQHAWQIASRTGERIRANCNKSRQVDELCPTCADIYQRWKELYDEACANRKAGKKVRDESLPMYHPLPSCPVAHKSDVDLLREIEDRPTVPDVNQSLNEARPEEA
jgi:hypothetical protein